VAASGQLREWVLDADAVAARIPWVSGHPERFERESREMAEHFPTWVLALGRVGASDYWDTGALIHHRQCGAPWVFDVGVRCADCRTPIPPEQEPPEGERLIAFAGRVPAAIAGRPWLDKVRLRLAALKEAGDDAGHRRLRAWFIKAEGNPFFAPPIFAFFPYNWAQTDPLTMVEPDYFDVLGLPPAHTYPGTHHRLCNYAHWRDVTLRTVLQQRIVPRVLIDVMLADLAALGHLESALEEAHQDMHSIYNVIGKAEPARVFSEVYARHRDDGAG